MAVRRMRSQGEFAALTPAQALKDDLLAGNAGHGAWFGILRYGLGEFTRLEFRLNRAGGNFGGVDEPVGDIPQKLHRMMKRWTYILLEKFDVD